MRQCVSDIAFTPAVKAIQREQGSRASYALMEAKGSWHSAISHDLKIFIESQISVFFATVNSEGQPYIQHRGGPPGFLQVLDEHTIGFVDFVGNLQYITRGNITENPKAHLFLIDYAQRRRVKVWGELHASKDNPNLLARLMPKQYGARASQVMLFTIAAWDANCPQHIPQRFEAADVAEAIAVRDSRIAELERELAQLANGTR